MTIKQIIPMPHKTTLRCLQFLWGRYERKAFHKDIGKIIHNKSLYRVFLPEMSYWNRCLANEFASGLLVTRRMKNLRTGAKNAILYQIHPCIKEIEFKEGYLVINIKRGENNEEGS